MVYDATHTGTRQPVAIKVLHRDGDDHVATRRFFREARATAGLDDPHIVRVLDVGVLGSGAIYMAMERLRGQTLEQFLQPSAGNAGVLTETQARTLAQQVLQGLVVAHRSGLVHRDIKPANLFLIQATQGQQATLHVKIVDFGIAWLEGSNLTESSSVVGSPNWMSPEQCEGLPIDARSDIYSLGAVLFRCLAGRPLFGDGSPMSAMYRHVHEAPEPLQRAALQPVSPQFCDAVGRALAKRPQDRFADAQAMLDCLHALPATRLNPDAQDLPAAPTNDRTPIPDTVAGARPALDGLAGSAPAWLRNTTRPEAIAPRPPGGRDPLAAMPGSDAVASNGNRAAAFALALAVLAALAWVVLEYTTANSDAAVPPASSAPQPP